MENLNAEQVKRGLERLSLEGCMTGVTIKGHSVVHLLRDALALINSQEQRIGELEAECEQWRSDWEENQKQWETAYDKLESENASLSKKVESLTATVKVRGETIEKLQVFVTDISEDNRKLTEERQDKEKLGLLIDEILKEKRELFEENKRLTEGIRESKADTVRAFAERLQAYFGTYVLGYKIPITEALKAVAQIANEILEGETEGR